jgi:putative iron-only hydrogenase system regulator
MEVRLGAVIIMVSPESDVQRINSIISKHNEMILGRQGIPLRDRGVHIISLVIEGDTDRFGSLTGQLGRLAGVRVKTTLIT